MGNAGITQECKIAVMRLIQFGERITNARILTSKNQHSLLLTLDECDYVAIKSGFTSGYQGEGPRGFAFTLRNLKEYGVTIDEYLVKPALIEKIDTSSLTNGDISTIEKTHPLRPVRWHEYIYDRTFQIGEKNGIWHDYPPIIPWSIIDPRIIDLALKFMDEPDHSLSTGYRRLEDIVRKRAKLEGHGASLFSNAFEREKGILLWEGLSPGAHQGRIHLFTGVYMAYRNPRAHQELKTPITSLLSEFLLLNKLYTMEGESVER